MLKQMFRAHGHFCASRPWEVIIGTVTLTLSLMSMSLFALKSNICGWNYKCVAEDDVTSSDLLLTMTRCLAIMYMYIQFRNLRKLGSKFLLGIAGVFTIFSSFVFSIAIINMFGSDLTGLNEALPFFLLLVDLAKASTLARFAFSAGSQEEVVKNIGRGMALIGPTITLDAMVESLVIGVGMLSGVRRLETMCCFGCLSVVANYLAFMTFYPACLALFLELTREHSQAIPYVQIQQIGKSLQEEEEHNPNPVTQRVKIIMSAGLLFVHAHSRWLTGGEGNDTSLKALTDAMTPTDLLESNLISPDEPLWMFYLRKATSIDYTVTLFLAIVLAVKYTMFDTDAELENLIKQDEIEQRDSTDSSKLRQKEKETVESDAPRICPPETAFPKYDEVKRTHKPSFTIGDDTSEEEDVSPSATKSLMTTGTQTESTQRKINSGLSRTTDQCVSILKSENGPDVLSDDEVIQLVLAKHIPAYKLENVLRNHLRGVSVRREVVSASLPNQEALQRLPFEHYDYSYVEGACCENVIGYMPLPVGVAGPLLLDGDEYTVPMATTEGCLVASTNRGCRALSLSGGVRSTVINDGMTRAPIVRFSSAMLASKVKSWLDMPDSFDLIAETFSTTSRFARLKRLHVVQAARYLYIRFIAVTGDAMGMNMLSKGTEKSLRMIQEEYFPDMEILSLSGNFCTDKKPSAINWLEGRGKSVVCEAVIPSKVVQNVLKTSVSALVDLNISKNLMGSAMAGSIGGFNAHAANVVTAIYIATGQDPAQNVCSSNCMTVMEASGENSEDLYVSCTMPSIEVGTIGGGTVLPPQAACLKMLGVYGSNDSSPGDNASRFARIICGAVLAGELSLMSALASGDLVKSHLKHNRSVLNLSSSSPLPSCDAKQPSRPSVNSQTQSSSREPGTCIHKGS